MFMEDMRVSLPCPVLHAQSMMFVSPLRLLHSHVSIASPLAIFTGVLAAEPPKQIDRAKGERLKESELTWGSSRERRTG